MRKPDTVINACLQAISERLDDAAAIARAAIACAEAGSEQEAVRIALDLDILLYEASTSHNAAALIGRIMRSEEKAAISR